MFNDEQTAWPKVDDRSKAESRADTARYIAAISAELAHMAAAAELDTLDYLLTMAQMEADVQSRRPVLGDF